MPSELQRKWLQTLDKLSQSSSAKSSSAPGAGSEVGARSQGGATKPVGSASRLGGSVGVGGRNAKADVALVQAALNPRAGLEEDGVCGKLTLGAILAFQKAHKLQPDGRIDPGGPTERALNVGAGALSEAGDGDGDGGGGGGGGSGEGGGESFPNEGGPVEPSDERGASADSDPEPDYSRLARRIHDAAEGFGTDEQAIFAALRELKGSRERRARLGEVYRQMFGEDLEQVLRDELDSDERAQAEDAANRRGGEPDFEALARQIHDAAEGIGTDEGAIRAALAQVRGRPDHMERLRAAYRSLFGESLDAVLEDELSGDELKEAQDDLDPRVEAIPDEGFDEVELIRGQEGEQVQEHFVPQREPIPAEGFDEVELIRGSEDRRVQDDVAPRPEVIQDTGFDEGEAIRDSGHVVEEE